MPTHLLNTFRLEVTAPDDMDGRQLQQDISDFVKKELIPKMEVLFDDLGKDKTIRIAKLNLSIDGLQKDNWEMDLIQKFIEQLKMELELEQREAETKSDFASLLSDSKMSGFLFFLENGYLPWWHNSLTINELQKEWQEEIIPEDDLKALKNVLKNNPKALKRMIYQLDNRSLGLILEKLSGDDFSFFSFYKSLEKGYSKWWHSRMVRLFIWEMSFDFILKNNVITNNFKKEILLRSIHYFSQQKKQAKGKVISEEILLEHLKTKIQDPSLIVFLKKSHLPKIDFPKKQDNYISQPKEIAQDNENNKSGFYIKNAGLVILHPFLQYLFEDLKMTSELEFVDDFQRHQAALLLQFLVMGKTVFEEHELLLNKILCNIPLDEPMESHLILTKKQRTESEQLLSAAIQHWSALKNTSPDGLRNTFLQREGKIIQKENGDWLLQVQSTGVDVLLSKLPWGVGMIKLPWMEGMLFVEWG